MRLDFSNENDPVMKQKHVVDGEDQDDHKSGNETGFQRGRGSISEYDSSCDEGEQLSQLSQASSEAESNSHETSNTNGLSESVRLKDDSSLTEIREVWAVNLVEEFREVCHLVREYPFVAMDTEFPGVVANPVGCSTDEYKYLTVKCNVNMLKIIQLGITLFNSSGNLPKGVCTWQFNFRFNLQEDMYAQESIDLLRNSGLDFQKHSTEGIETSDFAELFISSGLVLMENVTWMTFHSAYDFGYLLAQITAQDLPESETEFREKLKLYFPNLYDIRYIINVTSPRLDHLMGGLQTVANRLKVKRIGTQHQAGSDSHLTGKVFFKLYDKYFPQGMDDLMYSGQIYGIGAGQISTAAATSVSSTAFSSPLVRSNSIKEVVFMPGSETELVPGPQHQ